VSRFFRTFQHLLPRAKAWNITIDKKLRQFFDGLTVIQSDVIDNANDAHAELRPETATDMDRWFDQFNLIQSGTLATDRESLAGAWILNDYQSPKQIQDTLQAAGFDVYIHEWWNVPVIGSPTVRNPASYIAVGYNRYSSVAGADEMVSGDSSAVSGAYFEDNGYMLVNKTDDGVVYSVPVNAAEWPYIYYVGGSVFGSYASVPAARQNEFETLLLKTKPAEQWIGVLVTYI